MKPTIFKYNHPFSLELGGSFPALEIAYHTFGQLNEKKDNVIWVCHALTANSDVIDWWSGLFGKGKIFDEKKYFIVCANIIGSCYGSTGPLSKNPKTKKPYYDSFPLITVRDLVNAHLLLKNHLGIEKIKIGIGGSLGGYQLLEWAVAETRTFDSLILMTTAAKESSWGKGIHATQRMAIETDVSFGKKNSKAGIKGLKTARAIGLLSYRNYEIFCSTQRDPDDFIDHFKAESYLLHQGEKLGNRFNAYSYWFLTKTMDSHNLARGRQSASGGLSENAGRRMENVLKQIKAKTLVIGISSDILCPAVQQKFLAKHIPGAKFVEIDSPYGHDGFLIEYRKLSMHIREFFSPATIKN